LFEDPPAFVVFFLVDVVTGLFVDVTFIFLVLEDELDPLGVLRMTMVDLVPMPVDIWLTLCPRCKVFR